VYRNVITDYSFSIFEQNGSVFKGERVGASVARPVAGSVILALNLAFYY